MWLQNILLIFICAGGLVFSGPGCKKQPAPDTAGRTFRMGFANSAPRPDFTVFIQSLNLWTARADAAIISTEVPWDSLLAGESPVDYIVHNYTALVAFYRQKNFPLWVYIDPENGLDRQSDATGLVKRAKSIADADMQAIYIRFTLLMDSLLQPEHLGLALETNLIRGTAPAAIYNGVKMAAGNAAQAVRQADVRVKVSVSVQVDYAWGKLTGQPYIGIADDFTDFPFIQELGLSSYPYFNFSSPDEIPDDYYAKLAVGKSIPVMVTEGGWTSFPIPGYNGETLPGSPALQQRYIDRQAVLLNQAQATAWLPLTFTDIDIAAFPAAPPDNLKYFAFIGLVDSTLAPKPALASWDSLFHRPLR